jgi:hypothetical protein
MSFHRGRALCLAAFALMLPWPAVAADYLGKVAACEEIKKDPKSDALRGKLENALRNWIALLPGPDLRSSPAAG